MKRINCNSYLLIIVVFVFSQFVQAQVKVSDKDLPNFSPVSASFYRGA